MTTEYLNQTPKGCKTCFFREDGITKGEAKFWVCGKSGGDYCSTVLSENDQKICDRNFSGWRPIPPKPTRRSLRQWLYDLFLA